MKRLRHINQVTYETRAKGAETSMNLRMNGAR